MARKGLRSGAVRLATACVVLLATACVGEDPVAENPRVASLVGDWTATQLVITSVANPDQSPDLVALGALFTLNVQPSGQYTAILIYGPQAQTEIGVLDVSGTALTMTRTYPSRNTTTSIYALAGDRLIMDGDTEFDFDLDGTAEAAIAHFELVR